MRLIHAEIDSDKFLEAADQFHRVAGRFGRAEASELIGGPDWRHRLLGFALAATLGDWTLTPAIAGTLERPRGIAIIPAVAYLIHHHTASPETFPELDQDRLDRTVFDGEIGQALDQLNRVLSDQPADLQESGANYGQRLGRHLALYEWLASRSYTDRQG